MERITYHWRNIIRDILECFRKKERQNACWVRFLVLRAAIMTMTVFRGVMLCSLVETDLRIRGVYCTNYQGDDNQKTHYVADRHAEINKNGLTKWQNSSASNSRRIESIYLYAVSLQILRTTYDDVQIRPLKMKTVSASRTSVSLHETARRHIPQDIFILSTVRMWNPNSKPLRRSYSMLRSKIQRPPLWIVALMMEAVSISET
jgi:hypothetical protein